MLHDLKYAVRILAKNPGLTLAIVLTLALGIGANTAIFTVANAYLLKPLPFPDSERMVSVFDRQPSMEKAPASYADFKDWTTESRSLEEMAAYFPVNFALAGDGEPERVLGVLASEHYFSLLGYVPLVGHPFTAADHRPGAAPVVLISEGLWKRRFGGDPQAVGRPLKLNGVLRTIVGVLPEPPRFNAADPVQAWVPLEARLPWDSRGTHYLTVMARRKPGVTLADAQSDMSRVARQLDEQYKSGHGILLQDAHKTFFGDAKPALVVLLGAVGFVLLIAVVNVAGLLVARNSARAREFAIRKALGAGHARLIRQLLTESLLMAALGGICGCLLSLWVTDFLVGALPRFMPRPPQINLDPRVLFFTTLISVSAGILFGLAPAIHLSRGGLAESLKEGSNAAGAQPGRQRFRTVLVAAETAMAVILLAGAGLLIRSFVELMRSGPGFPTEHLLTMQINLPAAKYKEASQRRAFYQDLIARLASLPGVSRVGGANNLPLGSGNMSGDFLIEGRPPFRKDEEPATLKYIVTPAYLETMGIRLVRGRFFTEMDREGSPRVVIINEKMARKFWPGEDPVGRRMSWGGADWMEIVGIARDVKQDNLTNEPEFQSYVPFLQVSNSDLSLAVRTSGDPGALAAEVRRQVYAVDPEQPVYALLTMDDLVSAVVSPQRLAGGLLGVFASAALLLAALGIYGMVAFVVDCRTREIGLRIALGARSEEVLRWVIGRGLAPVTAGLVLGLLGGLGLSRAISGLLYGVRPGDPATFGLVTLLLASVALLACWIPARRASRVDPMVALRYE